MQSKLNSTRVRSVNVSGALRTVSFAGKSLRTGFFKTALYEAVYARKLGLEGDAQADLSVHGGPEKAVYFYPHEHYAAWEGLLGTGPLPPGSFGENITSEGLLEGDLNIGDVLQIGTAILQVRQPRSPCYKLQIRFGRSDMTALFYQHAKPGWYASVIQEGRFSAHDLIVQHHRAPDGITVADVWRYSSQQNADLVTRKRISDIELLPDFWKQRVARHINH